MVDTKDHEISNKDGGPSSIKLPMLTSTNYTVWAMRMKIALKVNKVWETIDPGSKTEEKNNMAIALLFQSIPEALTLQVGDLDTAKGVWDAIKTRQIDTRTLESLASDVFQGSSRDIMLKVDSQGNELDILRGGRSLLHVHFRQLTDHRRQAVRRRRPATGRHRDARGARARRPTVRRAQRRTAVHLHRGHLALC